MTIARELAEKQKQVSISEFFEKNKHLLGFDNPARALITGVKEALDNSLDACEEACILPQINIEITASGDKEYSITIEDNGPGIIEENIPKVFGQLLFGSRFHAHRQSRGQQGIGISAVLLYSQITTGHKAQIISKTKGSDAVKILMGMDVGKNKAVVFNKKIIQFDKEEGTSVKFNMKGSYTSGKYSVLSYIRSTSVVNPHASITFLEPNGSLHRFERCTNEPPAPAKEIKPHPYGMEVGTLISMAKKACEKTLSETLISNLYGVTGRVVKDIEKKTGFSLDVSPGDLKLEAARTIVEAIKKTEIRSPPATCLSPIGEDLIKKGMSREFECSFTVTKTESPEIFNGEPFIVEAGLLYGKGSGSDEVEILRFANRTPLLYQPGSDVIVNAVKSIDWRTAGFEQRGGKGSPYGPGLILVHIASTNIPYTSESKDSVAQVPEIEAAVIKCLNYCKKKLKAHVTKLDKVKKLKEKYELAEIIPEIADKAAAITENPVPDSRMSIARVINSLVIEQQEKKDNKEMAIKILIKNLTVKKVEFKLIAAAPGITFGPVPEAEIDGTKVKWDVCIASGEERSFIYRYLITASNEGEPEVFVKGLPANMVIGADAV